jgi:hypothetical protein
VDDVTLLADPVVLAALAFWAATDGRADAQERMAAAYDALVAANMWPAKFATYANASADVKLKTWKQAGVLKELPKPNAATQAAAADLYKRLYEPQQEPQQGFEDPPVPPATKEQAKQLALLAQIAALAKVPDALTRGFEAAGAMYTSDTWDLSTLTAYLAKSDADKLAQWANGLPYKAAWGMPPAAQQQAAVDLFRQLYAAQIADGTVQDPTLTGSSKPAPTPSGGSGMGTIALVGAALWGLSKMFGGR